MVIVNINKLLLEKGKTKYWFAKMTGLGPQAVNNLVNNETSGIKFSTLELACKVLECTPNDIFLFVEDKTEKI